jgi:hypothetical protein
MSVPPQPWGPAPTAEKANAADESVSAPPADPTPELTTPELTTPDVTTPDVTVEPAADSGFAPSALWSSYEPVAPAFVQATPAPIAEPPTIAERVEPPVAAEPLAPRAESPVPAAPAPAPLVQPMTEETAEAPAEPKKKRGVLAGTVFAIVVVLLLGAIGYVVYQKFFSDPTRDAVAGNCLADLPVVAVGEDKEVPKARIVACSDAAAEYVVEARMNNQSEAQAKSTDICKAYPNSTFIYRAVPPGGTGYVLCLKKLSN